MTTPQQAEAERLERVWQAASARYHYNDSPTNAHIEQLAYDQLIDYVEASGLNYTKWDPREAADHADYNGPGFGD